MNCVERFPSKDSFFPTQTNFETQMVWVVRGQIWVAMCVLVSPRILTDKITES